MTELTDRQIKEQDIDWYCLVNDVPTHIASMGGMIPAKFRDRRKLRMLQDAVVRVEPFSEVRLNLEIIMSQTEKGFEYLQYETIREAIEEVNRNNLGFAYLSEYDLPVRLFASTFVEKARRGFRSFARLEKEDGNEYVLIAEPATPIEYKEGKLLLDPLECEIGENGSKLLIL